MPVAFNTNVGRVRLLIPDIEERSDPRDLRQPPSLLFADEQIQAFLDINNGNVKRAAADAVRVIATTQSLLLKVLSTDDKSTDGAKLGAELRAQSKRLMDEADSDDKRNLGFDVAEWTPQPRDYAWH